MITNLTLFAAVALASLLFTNPNRWLSEKEYYSFTGSRTVNGDHQCLFCGHKGIYKKGEYGTQNVYASCSKCKKQLFHE